MRLAANRRVRLLAQHSSSGAPFVRAEQRLQQQLDCVACRHAAECRDDQDGSGGEGGPTSSSRAGSSMRGRRRGGGSRGWPGPCRGGCHSRRSARRTAAVLCGNCAGFAATLWWQRCRRSWCIGQGAWPRRCRTAWAETPCVRHPGRPQEQHVCWLPCGALLQRRLQHGALAAPQAGVPATRARGAHGSGGSVRRSGGTRLMRGPVLQAAACGAQQSGALACWWLRPCMQAARC